MLRWLYKVFFRWAGWTFQGSFDPTIPKFIVVVAPHTSNWDFVVGVVARSILRLHHVKFLGKKELFKWPYGFIFRWLGGYPVDRKRHSNLVETVVQLFNSKESFAIALAPEGTRKKVDQIKTGFYHIALQTGIPIIQVGFDFSEKTIKIQPPFYPTGHKEEDMEHIMRFFQSVKGKYPELGLI
jgi:1-acyl-sn-glycerol-3-phosphate acyltransferase